MQKSLETIELCDDFVVELVLLAGERISHPGLISAAIRSGVPHRYIGLNAKVRARRTACAL